jgi:hypothetical protein
LSDVQKMFKSMLQCAPFDFTLDPEKSKKRKKKLF